MSILEFRLKQIIKQEIIFYIKHDSMSEKYKKTCN